MKKTTVYGEPADGKEEEEEEKDETREDSDGKALKTFDAKSFRIKSRETVLKNEKGKNYGNANKTATGKIKTMAKSLEDKISQTTER